MTSSDLDRLFPEPNNDAEIRQHAVDLAASALWEIHQGRMGLDLDYPSRHKLQTRLQAIIKLNEDYPP